MLITPAEGWVRTILAGDLPLDNWIDLLCVLLFIGLGGVLFFQRRWSEGALVLIGALVPLSSGLLMSHTDICGCCSLCLSSWPFGVRIDGWIG